MIKLTIKKGVQTLTEICDSCKCHIQNLSVNDIIVKPKSLDGVTLKDSNGNKVTRKTARPKCYCEHCEHE